MSHLAVPSRRQWQGEALKVLFGEQPPASDPWPALLELVARFQALTDEIRDFALADAAGLEGVGQDVFHRHSEPSSYRPAVVGGGLRAPMRVVLMGRTMAGKSSLLTAMTGSHFDRIGDGRQRFSRDVLGAPSLVSEHIEVVDTPGVGAHGGADDTDAALKAALDADVVVWVNSSDSIQEESAAALKLLGVIGKPIIVAINCRQSLQGVGRLNLLRFPDRVFGNREGLVDEIKRHMALAGVEPLDVVYIHALAAAEAKANAEVDRQLHEASRIEDLNGALVREHAAHNETRRALRLVDGHRQPAQDLALSLSQGAERLRAQAARERAMTKDVHARLRRLVRNTGEAMVSDVDSAVGRRRDWHLSVTDFGKAVQSDWNDEVASLNDELAKALEARLSTLTAEIQSAVEAVDAEWATVSLDQFALRDLSAFDSVWGNRLARASIGIGSAVAVMAAGAFIGGPVGLAIAIVGGPAAGIVLTPLKNLVDRIFLGKDGVLRKRRQEVAKQVGPILDDLTQEYQGVVATRLDELRDGLASERRRSAEHSKSLEDLAARWTNHRQGVRELIRELDLETTAALLRMNGRERLARSVTRATRVPGVCILAEFEDVAFWEAWLFPPDLGETLAGGKAPIRGGESASALAYALSLAEAGFRLTKANDASALLTTDADLPTAIVETWSGALTAHIGRTIQIETNRRTSHQ